MIKATNRERSLKLLVREENAEGIEDTDEEMEESIDAFDAGDDVADDADRADVPDEAAGFAALPFAFRSDFRS